MNNEGFNKLNPILHRESVRRTRDEIKDPKMIIKLIIGKLARQVGRGETVSYSEVLAYAKKKHPNLDITDDEIKSLTEDWYKLGGLDENWD